MPGSLLRRLAGQQRLTTHRTQPGAAEQHAAPVEVTHGQGVCLFQIGRLKVALTQNVGQPDSFQQPPETTFIVWRQGRQRLAELLLGQVRGVRLCALRAA